jgi:hypothetical protein
MKKTRKLKVIWLSAILLYLIFVVFFFFSSLFKSLDEWQKLIIVILILLGILFKIGRDKKKQSAGIVPFLSTLQSVLISVLCLIAFTAFYFYFDYGVSEKIKGGGTLNYILLGLLSATASFFIIKANPKSVWYAPFIVNALLIVASFVSDFSAMCIFSWILTIITSWLGYRMGKKRINAVQ